jgi:hypothetical protein
MERSYGSSNLLQTVSIGAAFALFAIGAGILGVLVWAMLA